MYNIVVKFSVKDYAVWKEKFDAAAGPRQAAGLSTSAIIRSVDDPGRVIVVFETADLAAARTHLADPRVRKGQADSGFVAAPELFFGERM